MERQLFRHHARTGTRRDRVLYGKENCGRALGEGTLAKVLSFIEVVAMSGLTTETQRHRENEDQRDPRTSAIIGAAIEVHRHLGPGLLESAYEECLCYELHLCGLAFERQVDLPVSYKGLKLDCGYRIDLIVQKEVVVELKAIERIIQIIKHRCLTTLNLSELAVAY